MDNLHVRQASDLGEEKKIPLKNLVKLDKIQNLVTTGVVTISARNTIFSTLYNISQPNFTITLLMFNNQGYITRSLKFFIFATFRVVLLPILRLFTTTDLSDLVYNI